MSFEIWTWKSLSTNAKSRRIYDLMVPPPRPPQWCGVGGVPPTPFGVVWCGWGEFSCSRSKFNKGFLEFGSQRCQEIQGKRTSFEAGSNMKATFRLARADRGSDPPEKSTKAKKNDLRTQTPTMPICLREVAQRISPKRVKISPLDHCNAQPHLRYRFFCEK